MPLQPQASWLNAVRQTLQSYDETLLRRVAGQLVKPRSQWPVDELIERSIGVVDNPAVLDRRLQDLQPTGRRALAFIGHSRQSRWRLGNLIELMSATGHGEPLQPFFALLEAGLLYPSVVPATAPLKSFEQWLGQAGVNAYTVFAPPQITSRVLNEDLGLPECPSQSVVTGTVHEADGLEWPLRMSVVWQLVAAAPMRRTQQGGFFKRDLERLRDHPVLATSPADALIELPDAGLLAAALASGEGLLRDDDGELRAGNFPPAWEEGLPATLASLWAALADLDTWNPLDGYTGAPEGTNPFPSACLLGVLLLSRLPPDGWADPEAVGEWVLATHPYWVGESVRPSRLKNWLPTFLLGLAYQCRIVQAAKGSGGNWLVRLSSLGRWLLGFEELAAKPPEYPKTLTVQPNLEIMVFRQGLTPALLAKLARFAAWKTLGSVCVLQLEPETVYRALETGETFDTILQTLEQHGIRPTPTPVVEALRTWSNKRERLSIYTSATLLEFASAAELDDAFSRGLPATRISDRLAFVSDESAIDFRHFRLSGTRDYSLPPEKCVEIESDGVTLSLDIAKSDLLLETELPRFAESVAAPSANGRRRYRLTPASLAQARENGVTPSMLDAWFQQRAGQPLSPAARLLLTGAEASPLAFQRSLILRVPTEELANGLMQWPETRSLLKERLGPTAFCVLDGSAAELRERLKTLGVSVAFD